MRENKKSLIKIKKYLTSKQKYDIIKTTKKRKRENKNVRTSKRRAVVFTL